MQQPHTFKIIFSRKKEKRRFGTKLIGKCIWYVAYRLQKLLVTLHYSVMGMWHNDKVRYDHLWAVYKEYVQLCLKCSGNYKWRLDCKKWWICKLFCPFFSLIYVDLFVWLFSNHIIPLYYIPKKIQNIRKIHLKA